MNEQPHVGQWEVFGLSSLVGFGTREFCCSDKRKISSLVKSFSRGKRDLAAPLNHCELPTLHLEASMTSQVLKG